MASRATWSGSITFGMVNVPTKLYLAADEKAVRFNQLHAGCGARVRHLKRCESGHDVEMSDIIKGYEVTKDQYIEMTDDDFAGIELPSKHQVSIVRFVPRGSIQSMQFIKPYFVAPDGVGERGYALLAQAMTAKKVDGLGKLAFRESREHPVLVTVEDGRLLLHTLFWPDEIREWPVEKPNVKLTKEETDMASLLVENLTGEYDAAMLTDDYRETLLARIEQKLAGIPVAAPAAVVPKVSDLMDALKASVAQSKPKTAAKRKPAARKKAV